ncbi:MAG TPA: hypothetical protein VF629_03445 [Hymenobacter sp.]
MLVGTFLVLSGCEKAVDSTTPTARVGVGNSANIGRYLAFTDRAEFEEAVHNIDDLLPEETVDGHLAQWEEQHGNFYSMRKKHAEAAANGDSTACPIEDDYFAAVVSPEGTVQIADRIYRLDFAQRRIYHIPANRANELYDRMVSNPDSEEIKYYYFDEAALDLITTEDQGTSALVIRIGLGSGFGCGNGAERRVDDDYDYLANNLRMKCNAEYQKFGIYFSLLAKVKLQKRTLGIWFSKEACMGIIPDPGAFWREKCLNYTNYYNAFIGNSCNDNKAVKRYHESTRGLDKYQISVKFETGNFKSRRYYINQ